MQSGISASQSLRDAFAAFTSDPSLFCLPVTIESEALVPLDAVRFSNGGQDDNNNDAALAASLSSLSPLLQPKTPIYLLVRPRPVAAALLTAIIYVPSTAPVRAKTLFASTRQSLTRSLGLDRFGDSVFVTDPEEVTDPAEWAARERSKHHGRQHDGDGDDDDAHDGDELLSAKERELQRVKRAEEVERHGTAGKQLSGRPQQLAGSSSSSSGLEVRATDEARAALRDLSGAGELVQLGLDLAKETLVLLLQARLSPDQVQAKVPTDRPSYNFYRHPEAEAADAGVLFVYVCPGVSKVKERMMYASSRNGVIETAKAEGVAIAKRLELDADDITADRLAEEAGVLRGGSGSGSGSGSNSNSNRTGSAAGAGAGAGGGFARPKRPGRR